VPSRRNLDLRLPLEVVISRDSPPRKGSFPLSLGWELRGPPDRPNTSREDGPSCHIIFSMIGKRGTRTIRTANGECSVEKTPTRLELGGGWFPGTVEQRSKATSGQRGNAASYVRKETGIPRERRGGRTYSWLSAREGELQSRVLQRGCGAGRRGGHPVALVDWAVSPIQ